MEPTVLIIDDSEDDILLTKMVLARTGRNLRMESALSGETGLALLRDVKALPALILLDLKMPGMDGIDVLRRVRGDEKLCRIPVIVVTHSELESDREASHKAGANSFLHKAVDLDQFKSDLEHALECWMTA